MVAGGRLTARVLRGIRREARPADAGAASPRVVAALGSAAYLSSCMSKAFWTCARFAACS